MMVLLMVAPVCADVLSPVVFALLAATQLYVAAAPEVNPKFNAVPLQTLVVVALVIMGLGFTVTVTVWAVPTQAPAVPVGVTV